MESCWRILKILLTYYYIYHQKGWQTHFFVNITSAPSTWTRLKIVLFESVSPCTTSIPDRSDKIPFFFFFFEKRARTRQNVERETRIYITAIAWCRPTGSVRTRLPTADARCDYFHAWLFSVSSEFLFYYFFKFNSNTIKVYYLSILVTRLFYIRIIKLRYCYNSITVLHVRCVLSYHRFYLFEWRDLYSRYFFLIIVDEKYFSAHFLFIHKYVQYRTNLLLCIYMCILFMTSSGVAVTATIIAYGSPPPSHRCATPLPETQNTYISFDIPYYYICSACSKSKVTLNVISQSHRKNPIFLRIYNIYAAIQRNNIQIWVELKIESVLFSPLYV